MAAPNGATEQANKRIKLEDGQSAFAPISLDTPEPTMEKPRISEISTNLSHSREREVGILNWVNEKNPGFEGILKQRYVVDNCFRRCWMGMWMNKMRRLLSAGKTAENHSVLNEEQNSCESASKKRDMTSLELS